MRVINLGASRNVASLLTYRLAIVLLLVISAGDVSAQFYVPIPGIDGNSSQFTCKQLAGVPSTIQEIKADGQIVEKTAAAVITSLAKQIKNINRKISEINDALGSATGKQRDKLLNTKKKLTAQKKSVKFILGKAKECEDGELLFSFTGTPMFLSSTFPDPRPGYSGNLSGFLFGILFKVPDKYAGQNVCAVMSGASQGVSSLASAVYTDFVEYGAYVREGCLSVAGVDFCVNNFPAGELMIVLAQGLINEAPGTCSSPELCSVTEAASVLAAAYSAATLHSLRLAPLGEYCF